MIEVAYAVDDECLAWRRAVNRSSGSVRYDQLGTPADTWDPINGCVDVVDRDVLPPAVGSW